MNLHGNPATIYREMLTGVYVWPFFGTTNIDTESFNDFQKAVTFMDFRTTLDPAETNVIDLFKNFVSSTFSLFTITETDKFQIVPYAPRNLLQEAPALGEYDIVRSEVEANIEDLKNRITVDYGFSASTGSYGLSIGTTGSAWSHDNDLLLETESKFIFDNNEARTLMLRQAKRYRNGLNKYTITLPLTRLGIRLGSIYTVTDTDVGLATKAIQIINYQKDIDRGNNVQILGYDAESLYQRKGFWFWEHGTVMPPGTSISGTTTFIWGTSLAADVTTHNQPGTAHGINTAIYGTVFQWW